MERKAWVVNKSNKDFEKTDIDLKKHLVFKPFVPVHLPTRLAIKYVKQYYTLEMADHPEKYFKDRKMRQLVIRDAGIGDLLLLEPILRQLSINGEREVSTLSRFPGVYKNNPYIKENFEQDAKERIPDTINFKEYDDCEDLRSHSETCANRDKVNRTDCYNQKFSVRLDDPQPRIYFDKSEKSMLKKKKGVKYIGLALDGSHSYRRYERCGELIDILLKDRRDTHIVLMGSAKFMEYPKNSRVTDLQCKTDVREAMLVVKDLDWLISVDSGLMHVALAMYVPIVCIFSIIKPELRLSYYQGPREVIYKTELPCIGCGSLHMAICRHGNKDRDPKFIAPCLDIDPKFIVEKLKMLKTDVGRRLYFSDGSERGKDIIEPPKAKPTARVRSGGPKLTMPIIVLNEEKNLPRFIENVMSHPAIGRVIAIDGGSNDKTVELLEAAGAEVYMHAYDKDYHDAQALQRNVSCSFVRDGEKIIIMDIDECFSDELSAYLGELAESEIGYGLVSRRTFKLFTDIRDRSKQIKDYPDYQPRFFTWNRRFKWVGSPHHNVYNAPEPVKIDKDIIHFEAEGKDRAALERTWTKMDKKTKEVYA